MSVLRIERTFSAEPEKVFAFVTQSENLIKWWGPEGTSLAEHNLDLSRPGPWWFVLLDPEGGRHKVSGEVLAVDPPKSVEFTLGLHKGEPEPARKSTVRFEVYRATAGGTKFVLIHSGLTTEEMIENNNKGWSSTLRRLERVLDEG